MARTGAQRTQLSEERILDAALEVVDAEGGDFSMRRLGDRLGVEAMSVYHYFASKDALIDALVERALDRATAQLDGLSWREAVAQYARALRGVLLEHPGIGRLALGRSLLTPHGLQTIERMIELLTASGFTLTEAVDTVNVVAVFTVAHAVSEVDTRESSGQAMAAIADLAETAPLLARAASTGSGTDDEHRFEFALNVLSLGLQAVLQHDEIGDVR